MRVLKFRAWHTKLKEYVTDWVHFGPQVYVGVLGSADCETEQFTGLTDKNGKEIYEGDKDKNGNTVEFLNGSWCLNGDRDLFLMRNNFEVIGNIHENPELLN